MDFRLPLACLFVSVASAQTPDWPRWRGPDSNGHVPAGLPVPTTLPAQAKFVWKKKIGFGLGSPVVAGGKVYLLDNQANNETLHALDVATGEEKWNAIVDEAFQDGQTKPGPRGTPVVDADRIYVQSARGEFKCLSTTDGRVLWRTNFVNDHSAVFTGEKGMTPGAARHGNTGSPAIEGDWMFVNVGGQEGASVVCFDKRDGKVIWKSQGDIPGYSGPVIATVAGVKQVLAFSAEAIFGLRFDDGKLLWRVPVKTSYGRHVFSPIVVGDDLVLVGSHQVGLLGVRVTRDGEKLAASEAYLEKSLGVNFSSPVLHRGHLYGLGPGGQLFCADARTGKPAWSHDLPAGGRQEHAGFIVAGENLLVLAEGGHLLLVAADPKAYRESGRLKVCDENWCNPAYAQGRLFARDGEQLVCVQLIP